MRLSCAAAFCLVACSPGHLGPTVEDRGGADPGPGVAAAPGPGGAAATTRISGRARSIDPALQPNARDEATSPPGKVMIGAAPEPFATTKIQITYITIPHPDDEYEAWSLIQASPANYPIFILMTHGEETSGCLRPDETTTGGPYWYQGSSSPVGQPDLGEWVYGFPWRGKWSADCEAGRLESWHRFLDLMAATDSTLPYAPQSMGRVCFDNPTPSGAWPTRADGVPPVAHVSNCADVFANGVGARVVFDLGDGDLENDEVIWALQNVRAHRSEWSIPDLPEHAVIGAAYYNNLPDGSGPEYAACAQTGHPDHHAIHLALWNTHVGAGPQWGRTCETDPDVAGTGGRINSVSAAVDDQAFRVDPTTQARQGAHVSSYGWLYPTYYASCESGCTFARTQAFWSR